MNSSFVELMLVELIDQIHRIIQTTSMDQESRAKIIIKLALMIDLLKKGGENENG